MLSEYAKRESVTIVAIGSMATLTFLAIGFWPLALLVLITAAAALSFFRDPERRVPTQRGVVVSPADGHITSVHQIDHYEPLGEPVTCVRVFLSVLDVHVNRCPCHAVVESIAPRLGEHLSALNPHSPDVNASNLIVLAHPTTGRRVAAIRQVAGQFARTILCAAKEGQIFQRGQRIGMIKLGSTTELYLPASINPRIMVEEGEKVYGGLSVVAHVSQARPCDLPDTSTPQGAAPPEEVTASVVRYQRSEVRGQELHG